MLNINDLEKRWFIYKVKSYIPHTVITVSTIVIVVGLIALNTDTQTNKTIPSPIINKDIQVQTSFTIKEVIEEEPVIIHPVTIKKTTAPTIEKIVTTTYTKNEKIQLLPSLDFMKKMRNSTQMYYSNEPTTRKYTNNYKAPQKQTKTLKKKIIKEVVVAKEEKKRIIINRQNTQNDIHEIIKRFKKNNNPALSLFVAKKYYELENYQQSYNYALITNQINRDIDASWIIFSKSLVKLNKKDKAIKTLKKYIDSTHSSSAQILLDEIRTGKFR